MGKRKYKEVKITSTPKGYEVYLISKNFWGSEVSELILTTKLITTLADVVLFYGLGFTEVHEPQLYHQINEELNRRNKSTK